MTTLSRRAFLGLSAAGVVLTPLVGHASTLTFEYSPGVIEDALKRGRTVVVEYHAFWCSVCRRQERVIERLRSENPEYEQLYFVRVDWDDYRDLPVALDRNVFNRSTLLILKGDAEVERVVAATSMSRLRDFLNIGVEAARNS